MRLDSRCSVRFPSLSLQRSLSRGYRCRAFDGCWRVGVFLGEGWMVAEATERRQNTTDRGLWLEMAQQCGCRRIGRQAAGRQASRQDDDEERAAPRWATERVSPRAMRLCQSRSDEPPSRLMIHSWLWDWLTVTFCVSKPARPVHSSPVVGPSRTVACANFQKNPNTYIHRYG